ncbi:MAG: ribonucleoside-diphosphate reductase subunit alpha [Eubacteriales bacterium]|nr:ribonucleoside-diphosphate reductase subunit alpha [Eubacteriales bacterium]
MNIMIQKRDGRYEPLSVEKTKKMAAFACLGLEDCDPLELELDAKIQFQDGMSTKVIQKILIQAAIEKVIRKTTDEFGNEVNLMNQNWQYVAARLYLFDLYKEAAITRKYKAFGYGNFNHLVDMLTDIGGYGSYLKEAYSFDEIEALGDYIEPKRDYLFNYEGVKLLSERYLVKGFHHEVYELPQERFMTIAMHLAIPEGDRKVEYAKKFYDLMSNLKMTVATPTMANAGTPYHQLSSCFIAGVGDNLRSIYDVNTKFSLVSKHGGALGIYLGKVRALNSSIRGYKNASGGVIPWIRLYNDTAVAVDQLGKRKGGATVTLDLWHKDLYEFIDIRTNNGDDRRKAHDIFPSVSIPNLFMERLKRRENFSLFDPHEVKQVMGYHLEDFYDDGENKAFTERYLACEANENLGRIEIAALDIMKKIMKSAVETGTPFIFFRDTVNAANPNKHAGMIYASNLCHEIAQNVGFSTYEETRYEDGMVHDISRPGDMVTCNLNSVNLGRIDRAELEENIALQVRMADNVITLNQFPVKEAELTAGKYRAIGLGTSGYHHYLVNRGITWESEEHIRAADELYEDIAYYAIKASMELAKEKGRYPAFAGSDWETGAYFEKRHYESDRWLALAAEVREHGLRNGYLMAIAPTGSTSNIANTTAGVDPIFQKFFIEEKKGNFTPKTAPDLSKENFWLYKEAHTIDQQWSIRACGVRSRHVDQAQSFNLYITPERSAKEILDMYIACYEQGVKTIYYIRNRSLELDECTSCSS